MFQREKNQKKKCKLYLSVHKPSACSPRPSLSVSFCALLQMNSPSKKFLNEQIIFLRQFNSVLPSSSFFQQLLQYFLFKQFCNVTIFVFHLFLVKSQLSSSHCQICPFSPLNWVEASLKIKQYKQPTSTWECSAVKLNSSPTIPSVCPFELFRYFAVNINQPCKTPKR